MIKINAKTLESDLISKVDTQVFATAIENRQNRMIAFESISRSL